MLTVENKNAPSLSGWIIGAGAGLVAFGVAVVVGKLDLVAAGFIGAVVFLIVGLILGMPWAAAEVKGASDAEDEALPSVKAAAPPAPVAAPPAMPEARAADPVVIAAAPAAFMAEVPVAAPVAAPTAAPKPKAAPKAKAAAPAKAARAQKADGPERLKAARKGKADDLKEIEGIGPALEKLCNELGFYHFDQIASWSDADVDWVDQNMKTFKGRIVRDKWVAQAKLIVGEGLEAFRIRAKTNDY